MGGHTSTALSMHVINARAAFASGTSRVRGSINKRVWCGGSPADKRLDRSLKALGNRKPIFGELNEFKGMRILDLASGTGANRPFYPKHAEVVSMDYSHKMLAYQQEQQKQQKDGPCAAETHFVQADAQALPFSDNSFDAVVCSFAISFIPDAKKLMKELERVMKPGAKFVSLDVYSRKPHEFLGVAGAFTLLAAPFFAPVLWGDAEALLAKAKVLEHSLPFAPLVFNLGYAAAGMALIFAALVPFTFGARYLTNLLAKTVGEFSLSQYTESTALRVEKEQRVFSIPALLRLVKQKLTVLVNGKPVVNDTPAEQCP